MALAHDRLSDRLLRYSPWAAAALVGLCFLALVARVAMYAGAGDGSESQLIAAESPKLPSDTIPLSVQGASRAADSRRSTVQDSPGESTKSERGGVNEPRQRTGQIGAPEISVHKLEPSTPSSKSRLEIHAAPSGRVAGETAGSHNANARGALSPAPRPGLQSGNSPTVNAVTGLGDRGASLISQGHTSFFGLEAHGRRFVYVLDRSGSMGEPDNKPLAAAKKEVLASLSRLDGVHQFFVIFYNEDPVVFNPTGGGRQLVFADEQNKRSARRFIESVQAFGGTRHNEALLKAVALRPDVLFLLTDGEPKDDLTPDELSRLRRLNGGIAQIHVIQFAESPYERNSLVQLATENRGQHTYKSLREIAH